MSAVIIKDALIKEITRHVANGGSLVTFCKDNNLDFGDINSWISRTPDIARQYRQAMTARGDWALERVMHEVGLIAFSDLREAYNDDGSLKNIKDMPEHIARAIQAIDVDEITDGRNRNVIGQTKKLKLADKLKALELYGKQHGMFRERVEHSGTVSLESILEASYKKVDDV